MNSYIENRFSNSALIYVTYQRISARNYLFKQESKIKDRGERMEKIENKISYDIRSCAFRIHNTLGPGLLESVYEVALSYELNQLGYKVANQIGIPMKYADIRMDVGFRLDILVNDLVIVEVKSVEKLIDIYHKQLLTYLKLSNKKLGLLINFNSALLIGKESIIRIVNNL